MDQESKSMTFTTTSLEKNVENTLEDTGVEVLGKIPGFPFKIKINKWEYIKHINYITKKKCRYI